MSQEELALKCGLTQQYISALEKDIVRSTSPTLHVIESISNALQVCPKDLIDCTNTCPCGKLKK